MRIFQLLELSPLPLPYLLGLGALWLASMSGLFRGIWRLHRRYRATMQYFDARQRAVEAACAQLQRKPQRA